MFDGRGPAARVEGDVGQLALIIVRESIALLGRFDRRDLAVGFVGVAVGDRLVRVVDRVDQAGEPAEVVVVRVVARDDQVRAPARSL